MSVEAKEKEKGRGDGLSFEDEIKPYLRSASQEFSSCNNAHWDSPWDSPWSSPYNNERILHAELGKLGEDEVRNTALSKLIQVRRDAEEFGFIHNLLNDVVFYASLRALEGIKALMGKTVNEISKMHPELLKALEITR